MVYSLNRSLSRLNNARLSLILFPFFLLASCGGGGGDGSGVNPAGDSSSYSSPYPRTEVNGNITGTLWISGDGATFNLSTGEYKTISQGNIYPSRDGTEYIETASEYRTHPSTGCRSNYEASDSLLIRDTATGLLKSEINAKDSGLLFITPAQLSPDGQSIAVLTRGDDWCNTDTDYRLIVFDREGNEQIRAKTLVKSFDWLPDNRLALAIEYDDGRTAIGIEAERNTLSSETIADLSTIEGVPRNLRVSNDGSKIVFEMVTGASLFLSTVSYRDATVWQVNIDGSNLRKVLDTSRTNGQQFEEARVNSPIFSPDGQWLLATENYISGSSIIFYGTETDNGTYIESVEAFPVSNENLTYIMPADAGFQRLPPASFDVDLVRPLLGSSEEGLISARGIRPLSRIAWTPSIDNSKEYSGGLALADGRANRGISGVLHYLSEDLTGANRDKPKLSRYDIQAGKLESIFFDTSPIEGDTNFHSLTISDDGGMLALFDTDSFDENYLRFYTPNGDLIDTIDTSNFTSSSYPKSLKFSPADSNLIAWKYRILGDNTIVAIVDIEKRLITRIRLDTEAGIFAWMPSGDLIVADNDELYLYKRTTTSFSDAVLLLKLPEVPDRIDFRKSDNRVVYSALGRIYTINSDGSSLVKVADSNEEILSNPSWSADGKHILVESWPDIGSSKSLLVLSADANNVKVYDGIINRPGYILLGEENASSTRYNRADSFALWF